MPGRELDLVLNRERAGMEHLFSRADRSRPRNTTRCEVPLRCTGSVDDLAPEGAARELGDLAGIQDEAEHSC